LRASTYIPKLPGCLAAVVLVFGCSSSNFSSSTAKSATPAPATAPAPTANALPQGGGTPAGSDPPAATSPGAEGAPHAASPTPPNCGANGVTKATLLTSTVQNNTPGNYIEYKLTVTDCMGKQIPFTAATVSFDIGAAIGMQQNLAYTITDAGNAANTMTGTLINIPGHDLFGNSGSNYYHYQTDKPVAFAAQANAIIVRVKLNGMSMVPYGTNSAAIMNTYLAFGATAPVTAPVTLTGSPAAPGIASILQRL